MEQECKQHILGGRVHDTEHFQLLVKRCRICGEFIGVETAVKPEPEINVDPQMRESNNKEN